MLKRLNEYMEAIKIEYYEYCQQNYDISGDNEFTQCTDFMMANQA